MDPRVAHLDTGFAHLARRFDRHQVDEVLARRFHFRCLPPKPEISANGRRTHSGTQIRPYRVGSPNQLSISRSSGGDGLFEGASHEYRGQVGLVLDRAVEILENRESVGGARPPPRLRPGPIHRCRSSPPRSRGPTWSWRSHRSRRHGIADSAVGLLHPRRCPGHRVIGVAAPAAELVVARGAPGHLGIRISMAISSGSIAVVMASRKKSEAAISRVPPALLTTIVPPSANTAAGWSAAMSTVDHGANCRAAITYLDVAGPGRGPCLGVGGDERVGGRGAVANQGADRNVVAVVAHGIEAADAPDVDHHSRGEQPHLHQRKQAHPSRHHLARRRPALPDASSSLAGATYSNGLGYISALASWIACHTLLGRRGMSMCLTPRGRGRPPPR